MIAASALLVPGSEYNGRLLRAMLANIACGLMRDELDEKVCAEKLDDAAAVFLKRTSYEEDAFLEELVIALDTSGDGWYHRQPGLSSHLDAPLVAVSDHLGIAAWMGQPGSLAYKDDGIAKDACRVLNRLLRSARAGQAGAVADHRLDTTVGKPSRPLWLTPMFDDMRRIVERAESFSSSGLANDACATLGLSHMELGCPVVAVVTQEPAAIMLRDRGARLAGPTSLEAGGFRHFRHWPNGRVPSDGYGRTYELRGQRRAALLPSTAYGAPEAVCPAVQLRDIAKIVYIGKVAAEPIYDRDIDDNFCEAVGAKRSAVELLTDIVNHFGP